MSQEWPVGRRHCELCVVIVDVTDEETLPMAWEGFVAQFLWRMAGEWGKGNPDGADDWVPSNPHPISLIRMGTRDTKNETHRTVAEEEGVSDQYLHLYEDFPISLASEVHASGFDALKVPPAEDGKADIIDALTVALHSLDRAKSGKAGKLGARIVLLSPLKQPFAPDDDGDSTCALSDMAQRLGAFLDVVHLGARGRPNSPAQNDNLNKLREVGGLAAGETAGARAKLHAAWDVASAVAGAMPEVRMPPAGQKNATLCVGEDLAPFPVQVWRPFAPAAPSLPVKMDSGEAGRDPRDTVIPAATLEHEAATGETDADGNEVREPQDPSETHAAHRFGTELVPVGDEVRGMLEYDPVRHGIPGPSGQAFQLLGFVARPDDAVVSLLAREPPMLITPSRDGKRGDPAAAIQAVGSLRRAMLDGGTAAMLRHVQRTAGRGKAQVVVALPHPDEAFALLAVPQAFVEDVRAGWEFPSLADLPPSHRATEEATARAEALIDDLTLGGEGATPFEVPDVLPCVRRHRELKLAYHAVRGEEPRWAEEALTKSLRGD